MCMVLLWSACWYIGKDFRYVSSYFIKEKQSTGAAKNTSAWSSVNLLTMQIKHLCERVWIYHHLPKKKKILLCIFSFNTMTSSCSLLEWRHTAEIHSGSLASIVWSCFWIFSSRLLCTVLFVCRPHCAGVWAVFGAYKARACQKSDFFFITEQSFHIPKCLGTRAMHFSMSRKAFFMQLFMLSCAAN